MRANQVVSPRQLQAAIGKLEQQQPSGCCADCGEKIDRKPKGPAPIRCPEHAKAHKALLDRTRPRKPAKPKEDRPPCCAESATGTCPQHRQSAKAKYDAGYCREDASVHGIDLLFGIFDGDGFSVE